MGKHKSNRHTRYQGAIIRDHHLLLIQHQEHKSGRTYWILPGGGLDVGETEEQCIRREMKEETNLDVNVHALILDEPGHPGGVYKWMKTYLCDPGEGSASPGYEPELEAAAYYSIVKVRWFDLHDDQSWEPDLVKDSFTFPLVQRIRRKLGYLS
jgi:8-oxo-dGTP diphosphatase